MEPRQSGTEEAARCVASGDRAGPCRRRTSSSCRDHVLQRGQQWMNWITTTWACALWVSLTVRERTHPVAGQAVAAGRGTSSRCSGCSVPVEPEEVHRGGDQWSATTKRATGARVVPEVEQLVVFLIHTRCVGKITASMLCWGTKLTSPLGGERGDALLYAPKARDRVAEMSGLVEDFVTSKNGAAVCGFGTASVRGVLVCVGAAATASLRSPDLCLRGPAGACAFVWPGRRWRRLRGQPRALLSAPSVGKPGERSCVRS